MKPSRLLFGVLLLLLALPIVLLLLSVTPNELMEASDDAPSSSSLLPFPQLHHLFFLVTDLDGTKVEGSTFVRFSKNQSHFAAPDWQVENTFQPPVYRYQKNACAWCSTRTRACSKGGKLSIRKFQSEYESPTKSMRELISVLDYLLLRPATKIQGRPQASRIQQVHITCEGLTPPIPMDEDGILTLQSNASYPFNPRFVQHVERRKRIVQVATGKAKIVLCTRSLYSFSTSSQAIRNFLFHYLDTMHLDKVFLYETGNNMGKLLGDIVWEDDQLLEFWRAGRIELVDFRDELQRQFGPISNDVVLFSRNIGASVQGADCIARAKLQGFSWAIHLEWHDFLVMNKAGGMHALVEEQRGKAALLEFTASQTRDALPCFSHTKKENEGQASRHLLRLNIAESWAYSPNSPPSSYDYKKDQDIVVPTQQAYFTPSCFATTTTARDSQPGMPVVNWALDFGGNRHLVPSRQ